MKRRIAYLFWLIALGLAGCASPQPAYRESDEARRHATAMQWSRLTMRAEQAIVEWMIHNAGEEQIHTRRYYTYWTMDSTHEEQYLVLQTSLRPARGNYASIDFVVVRDDPTTKPIVWHFGDGSDRYVRQVVTKEDGFQVDYFQRDEGDARPASPGRSIFLFLNGTLQEVVMGPDQIWEQTTFYQNLHSAAENARTAGSR